MADFSPSLVLGRVIEIQESPEGFKARLQRLDRPPGIETDWVLIATPMASAASGLMLSPAVGDMAVLGFAAKRPIILGFVFSGDAEVPTDTNKNLILQSRDENKIILHEEDDSGITLADSNGNEIIMNADGITINCAGTLTINTDGDANVETGGTHTIKGSTIELNP